MSPSENKGYYYNSVILINIFTSNHTYLLVARFLIKLRMQCAMALSFSYALKQKHLVENGDSLSLPFIFAEWPTIWTHFTYLVTSTLTHSATHSMKQKVTKSKSTDSVKVVSSSSVLIVTMITKSSHHSTTIVHVYYEATRCPSRRIRNHPSSTFAIPIET